MLNSCASRDVLPTRRRGGAGEEQQQEQEQEARRRRRRRRRGRRSRSRRRNRKRRKGGRRGRTRGELMYQYENSIIFGCGRVFFGRGTCARAPPYRAVPARP
jgi:hypothetical protein